MFYKSNMSMGYMESPKNTPKRSRSLSNLANAWQASNKVSRLQTQLETLKYKLFKKDETIQDLWVWILLKINKSVVGNKWIR